ncbi:PMCA-type calcium-translocating P-type ATPase, partial [Chytriomyces sp. MP71]
FGITPDEIHDLIDPKSPEKLSKLGGVVGVARRLRTNIHTGLSESRDALTGSWKTLYREPEGTEEVSVEEDERELKLRDLAREETVRNTHSHSKVETAFATRKETFGDNVLPEPALHSFWEFVREALKDQTLIILIIASVVDVAIGIYKTAFAATKDPLGFVDGVAIIVAVVVIVMISSVNDFRKQAQFHQLSDFSSSLSKVQVTRNGQSIQIKTTELLVGDVLIVNAGDVLPADGLVIQSFNITTDESSMTGESVTLVKDCLQDPFLFSGTKVVNGVGKMLVIATGRNSMNGRLMAALEAAEPDDTPLQVKLGGLADLIAKYGTGVAVFMFVILAILYGVFHHDGSRSAVSIANDVINLFIIAITLVVVAVPEGLPLAVTISLAHATLKMLKDNNLVRHLKACETMGNATTICSDKTGTLTQNKMQVVVGVVACHTFGAETLSSNSMEEQTLKCSLTERSASSAIKSSVATFPDGSSSTLAPAVSQSGFLSSKASEVSIAKPLTEYIGSKTEVALLEFTKGKLGREYPVDREGTDVLEVIPFSSDRKRMSTVVKIPREERTGKLESYLFGSAAELVIKLCDRYVNAEGRVMPLTDTVRAEFEESIETMASCALRTICLAFKPVKATSFSTEAPQIIVNDGPADENEVASDDSNLILAGIVGIKDPIRPEVPGAVADCRRAGVVVRMVTGDNITTARSIAKNAGILPTHDDIGEYAVMDGPTFRKLSPDMMDIVIPQLRVLARSSPLDKQVLVNNLKRLGETVAVTGDGTNDAPALRSADVGFSMGIAGTEMAKEASDIILLDDNFASLSKAIIWGRSVYDSVRKFLQFQLTVNIVAVVLTVVSSFLTAIFSETKTPLSALTAVQLLWVNLIMDTFAALALATDPPTPELLNRPPSRKSDPLINYDMWKMITIQSIYQIIVCIALYVTKTSWNGREMDVIIGDDVDTLTDSYMLMGTLVFNTFVFCQLFNELNCRIIGRDLNVFKNISKNPMFTAIVGGSVVVQVIIVQFGGAAFKTVSLGGLDWLLCLGLAFVSLPLGALVRLSPDVFKKE